MTETNEIIKLSRIRINSVKVKHRIQLSIILKMIGLSTIGCKKDPTVSILSILLAGTLRIKKAILKQ
jgi:hypothetical protein